MVDSKYAVDPGLCKEKYPHEGDTHIEVFTMERNNISAMHWWLKLAILVTWEAGI
jgi:hypothetical protein